MKEEDTAEHISREGRRRDVRLDEVRQVMPGGSYYVESIGMTNTPPAKGRPVVWSIYVDPLHHRYEVAGWLNGRVKESYTVSLREGGHFSCTCLQGQKGFTDSARGYCQHVNRLTLHAVRRQNTLDAPAKVIEKWVQELPIWSSSQKTSTVGAAEETAGSNVSRLSHIHFTAPTASRKSNSS